MNRDAEKSVGNFGLLANGSSRLWDVAVEEALDREQEWFAELDGPHVYLVFQVVNLEVPSRALKFLRQRLASPRKADQPLGTGGEDDTLTIGRFGSASVSLMWDNEQFPRCFVVIGPKARSTMRLTLQGQEIESLAEALQQVVDELPPVQSQ
jgi:hypothetical protein